jgi:hypothetical protein
MGSALRKRWNATDAGDAAKLRGAFWASIDTGWLR